MSDAAKLDAARRTLAHVEAGMVVGLGSGSTSRLVVKALGEKVRAGLAIRAIASSSDTRRLAEAEGIPLVDFSSVSALDVTIDGADEVDPERRMIKGRGAALLYEKILAAHSRKLVIAIDASKQVAKLGTRFPVPVEVIPLAAPVLRPALEQLGATVELRRDGDRPAVTDEGNQIYDCRFGPIDDPEALALALDRMVGVVEHGLFIGFAPILVIGQG